MWHKGRFGRETITIPDLKRLFLCPQVGHKGAAAVSAEEQSIAAFVNVGDVPQEEIPVVLGRVLTVGAALFARLAVPQASPAPALDPLLTAEQVASQLGLPAPRVYEMARQGVLPFVRVGKKLVRFEGQAINSWIAAHRVTAGREVEVPALSLVSKKAGRKKKDLTESD